MAAPAITAPKSALSVSTTDALAAREKLIAAYDRAFARAVADKMVCYHDRENDTWAVPSTSTPGTFNTVTHNGGSDWANLSCSGPKCGRALACKHRAVVAYARKNHISAVLPRCTPCDPRFCEGGCPDAVAAPACTHFNVVNWEAACGCDGYVCPGCGLNETDFCVMHLDKACEDISQSIEQHIADQEETASESLDYLEAERERGYEAPASEDVIWEAEQAYGDAIERDYEYLVERPNAAAAFTVAASQMLVARQFALGRSLRAVTLDGASPAYLASIERDAARAQELSAERMVAWAAAPRESDPLGAFFG